MDAPGYVCKSQVKGRVPRRLWALIMCLAIMACGLAGCKTQDEALADSYRNAAQEAVDAGNLDAAIALLKEAVANAGPEELMAMPEGLFLLNYHGEVYLPLEEVCAALGVQVYTDAEEAHLYCTTAAGPWTAAEGYQVPVLMYHGVTDDAWGSVELFVSPANLEEQLEQEPTQSKLAITRMTGREPCVLCYPYGDFSQTVLEMTEEYYHFGIAMNSSLYITDSQAATSIPRYYVSRYTTLGEYKYMVQWHPANPDFLISRGSSQVASMKVAVSRTKRGSPSIMPKITAASS